MLAGGRFSLTPTGVLSPEDGWMEKEMVVGGGRTEVIAVLAI